MRVCQGSVTVLVCVMVVLLCVSVCHGSVTVCMCVNLVLLCACVSR